MRFEKKVSIVTGGGSGIGLETAKRLYAEGASVVLNGRNEAKLRAAAAGFAESSRTAIVACDIGKVETSAALVEAAEKQLAESTFSPTMPASSNQFPSAKGRKNSTTGSSTQSSRASSSWPRLPQGA